MPPAAVDPQLTEVIAVVHALSAYTPMFGDDAIVPVEGKFWLTVTAAKVEVTSAKAATVRRITIDFGALIIAIVGSPLTINRILRLNKHYLSEVKTEPKHNTNTKQPASIKPHLETRLSSHNSHHAPT